MDVKTLKLQQEHLSGLSSQVSSEAFETLFNLDQFAMAISNDQGEVLRMTARFEKFLRQYPDSLDLKSMIPSVQAQLALPALPHKFSIIVPGKVMNLSCIRIVTDSPAQITYLWTLTIEINTSFRSKIVGLKILYRSFMDTSFELMFRTDRKGNILFANKLFLKSFGWSASDISKGLNVTAIFDSTLTFESLGDRVSDESHLADEPLVFKRKDGSAFPVVANIRHQVDVHNQAVLNWTVLDISRQKEGEQNLKLKNDELAKVNNQMEKFLYSTSHDLRSPIATILGLVNLIRLEVKSVAMVDYVSKIEISTLKLDKIIKDIMSFSKATYQRLNSERVDFEAMAWKAFNNYRDDPATRKISFEVNVEARMPFYTDTERLDIILDNIIRNSIHFFDHNKSRSFIKVKISTDKQNSFLEIIDNGIGVGAQHIDSIFKMFYKASHLSKGAGLGLYIVKETVEKLHGEISVDSEVGFGTVIRIRIPNDHKGKLIGRKLQLQSNFDVSDRVSQS